MLDRELDFLDVGAVFLVETRSGFTKGEIAAPAWPSVAGK